MKIMGSEKDADVKSADAQDTVNPVEVGRLTEDTKLTIPKKGSKSAKLDVTITSSEKKNFLDSVITNDRFRISYKLFGGKVDLTVRSLTFEETRAIASWCLKNSVSDVTGQMSGKFRRYLFAAQVEFFNGTKFDPLPSPLFPSVDEDGKKEIPPAWVDCVAVKYWDSASAAAVSAVAACVSDFESKYDYLTKMAEDVNFWNPDTSSGE